MNSLFQQLDKNNLLKQSLVVKNNTATDTDGITGRALKMEIRELKTRARSLLVFLETEKFLRSWISANLTHAPKLADCLSTVRTTICFLEITRIEFLREELMLPSLAWSLISWTSNTVSWY